MKPQIPGPLSLLLASCRRVAVASLYELAGNLAAQTDESYGATSFAIVHNDDILRLPETTLSDIGLRHGGKVALVPRPHTGIVELMSHETYLELYCSGDPFPHRRRPRLQPLLSTLAEGFATMASRSGSWRRKP
jgi:hypothetical protein